MDIHRCRFVPYPASAISSVAFSHSVLPATKKTAHKHVAVRLAIGRANGDVEIWNPLDGAWHQEKVLPGGKDRSIDGLVWVTEPDERLADNKTVVHGQSRLFSIGYTSAITEWDLERGVAKKHASGPHGDIWCLAVQPPLSGSPRKLVAGTSDGSLILYSIADGDLAFERAVLRTPKKRVKMVSIAFQSRHVAVVGCSDSTIRAYDVRNGSTLRTMTLGSDLAGGARDIIVWAVRCLPNGDIVSGDSTGQLCIWDGKTYTQAQRIQSHTQDVLSLAASADGSRIFSGGMDRRTVLYEPIPGHQGRWSKVWHRRYHSHDVKTMASFEGRGLSVVVSGGPDASPVILPLQAAGKEYHRTLSHLPQTPPLQSAPKARFVISWWEREVHVWQIPTRFQDMLDDKMESDFRRNHRKIGRIVVIGQSNINAAAISDDGSLVVVATATDVKAFRLVLPPSPDASLQISRVDVARTGRGATKLQIAPDKSCVCWVDEGSRVVVAPILSSQSSVDEPPSYAIPSVAVLKRLRRNVPKHTLLGGLGTYDRTVSHVAFSPDAKMLAVADLAGYIDTWVLRGLGDQRNGHDDAGNDDDDDAMSDSSSDDDASGGVVHADGARWIRNPRASLLPKLSTGPVCLSFSEQVPGGSATAATASTAGDSGPADDYFLLAITVSKRLLAFNPLRGALSDWSRTNSRARLPEQFRVTKDLVKGLLWQGPRLWIYGVSYLFMLDLSVDLRPAVNGAKQQGTKRKRPGAGGPSGGAGDRIAGRDARGARGGVGGSRWAADVDMADADERKSEATTSSGPDEDDYEDEDDDDDDEDSSSGGADLQLMRDGRRAEGVSGSDGDNEEKGKGKGKRAWWHTYSYRSVLGIVPLEAASQGEEGRQLEVAIVERPIWDVDLPPRYLGEGEHER